MPGAELIAQPVYIERRNSIEQACYTAGVQIVKQGKVDKEFMEVVSDTQITQKEFQEYANYAWELLDGKASYLKDFPRLDYTGSI